MNTPQLVAMLAGAATFVAVDRYRQRQYESLRLAVRLARWKYGLDSPEYLQLDQRARIQESLLRAAPWAASISVAWLGPGIARKLLP